MSLANRRADRHANRRDTKSFVGIDGEGGTIRGNHEYLLLRAGSYALETGKPLTGTECLDFISKLPTDGIYVAFFFDYDVTMILRDLPEERLRRLLNREARTSAHFKAGPLPVDWQGFQIDYLPGKEFRVRREIGPRKYSPWVVVNDVGSFFQSSFVTALTKWFGGQGEWDTVIARIAEGKEQRNSFGAVTEDEREYNLLEIKALELLMEQFRDVCGLMDLKPTKWQGPGNLVAAQFRKVGMPRNRDTELFETHTELLQMANDAYYGGRFEAATFGHVEGPIYQYDINSAYAYTYQFLPCLQHGEWEYVNEQPESGLYVGDVSFEHRTNLSWYTLPIRTRLGSIVFPRAGRGTYWSTELNVSRQYGARICWHGGYRYLPRCGCNHFEWVYDLYAERQRIGKDARGRIIKLVLASIYGKLAQSVGSAPYANPIWAGLITSTVRAQLIAATLCQAGGRATHMLATDGLFSTEPLSGIDIGTRLGQWDLKIHESMFIVQSGVYYLGETLQGGKTDDPDVKTRGVPQRKVVQHTWDFVSKWERYVKNPAREADGRNHPGVRIKLRNFIGLRLAIARNRKELAGQWVESERHISFDWTTKRQSPQIVNNSVTTSPPDGNLTLRTVPYQRNIGAFQNSQVSRVGVNDQPDWADQV